MNTVDVIVVLVVLVNALIGAVRGFVWQGVRLGGVVLGIFLARTWGPGLAGWSESWLSWDPTGRRVIAYVVIFVGTYVLASLVAHLFRKLLDKARLTSTDRSLGFILGGAKGLLFVWIAFYFLLMFYTFLPTYAQTQLKGDQANDVPPSKAFQTWDRWIRGHLDTVMPPDIQVDHRDAVKAFTAR